MELGAKRKFSCFEERKKTDIIWLKNNMEDFLFLKYFIFESLTKEVS